MKRFVAASLALVAASAAFAGEWRRYHNARFGVSAEVPVDWRMGPPPENDDGRVFASPEGDAEIIVSGSHVLEPLDQEFARMLAPDGATVEYKSRGRDRVVVSGRKGARIYYRKALLSCGATVWNSVYLEYPAARKAAFDPIVAHVAASLRGGKGANCK